MDPFLNDLHNILNSFKAIPIPPPAAANKTSRILAAIQLKIRLARKSIESKINRVWDAQKEEDAFLSLPKIEANLQLLEDVLGITNKELNAICNQVVNGELKEDDVAALVNEVTAGVPPNLSHFIG